MSPKAVARSQCQHLVDQLALTPFPTVPPGGWLQTVRKALGMSGPTLADRMGVTRARVAQAEQAELSGAATLRSMQAAAEAMGCRFLYAIVPDGSIEDLIAAQAHKRAEALVRTASAHMALEDQALPEDKIARDVSRLAHEIAREMPSDLWQDR